MRMIYVDDFLFKIIIIIQLVQSISESSPLNSGTSGFGPKTDILKNLEKFYGPPGNLNLRNKGNPNNGEPARTWIKRKKRDKLLNVD